MIHDWLTFLCQAGAGVQNIGTLVKNDPEEAPIGVMSVLGLAKHAAAPWMAQLAAFLREKAAGGAGEAKLAALLARPGRTALLVSERLSNCPPVGASAFIFF